MIENIDRYRIIKLLGKGSMGMVYLAHDPRIDRDVAIKTIMVDESASESEKAESKQRFLREAKSAGKLMHSSIVAVFDFGEHEGIPYLVMEYIDGNTSLAKFTSKSSILSFDKLIKIFSDICDAMEYAHSFGLVHRDMKPSNIMMTKAGQIKIMDFGLAKSAETSFTSEGILSGTPSYMSPEQIKGKHLDCRSDLFSIGVMFYEMLTGEKPFKGENVTSVIYSILNDNPAPASVLNPALSPGMDIVLEKALQKNPANRFKSSAELGIAILNFNNFKLQITDDEAFEEDSFLDDTQIASQRKIMQPIEHKGTASAEVAIGNIFRLKKSGILNIANDKELMEIFFDEGLIVGCKTSCGLFFNDTEDFVSSLPIFSYFNKELVFREYAVPDNSFSKIILLPSRVVFLLVGMVTDCEQLRVKFRAITDKPRFHESAADIMEGIPVSPGLGFAVSRIDGKTTFAEILDMVNDQQTAVLLFNWMVLTGAVIFEDYENADLFTDPVGYLAGKASASRQKEMDMHDMIVGAYQKFKSSSPYEILGINESSDIKQISSAYKTLSEKYERDKFPDTVRNSLRQELMMIEMSLTEAHLATMGKRIRKNGVQDEETGKKLGKDSVVRMELTKTDKQLEKEQKAVLADSYYEKALSCFQNEDYWRCIQLCESAVKTYSDKSSYHTLLADALSKNEKWHRKAIVHYKIAAELDPFNERVFLALGALYLKMDLKIKAIDTFKQGIKFNAGSRDLKRSLKEMK